MTDDFICPRYKSHPRSARRFAWIAGADGEWRAYVDCMACDPPQRIDEVLNPDLYADLLPPKPTINLKPMI
jgi:hypothetical protein